MRLRTSLEHQQFIVEKFKDKGVVEDDAIIAAEVLTLADLRGIDSHGIARLDGYLRLIDAQRINPKPLPKTVKEKLATINIDADAGLGLYVAQMAMEKAIEKAKTSGVCFATIHNSSHFGIGAAHALKAVKENLIGFAFTNASPLVAPFGAAEPYWGTNPICYAIPAGKYPPIVIDLATSAAANGKLELKAKDNLPIPNGWAIDKQGLDSNDALILKNGGSLLPLGSNEILGAHKGSALGALVDILSGCLSGAAFAAWAPPFVSFKEPKKGRGVGLGHVVGAIDVEAFIDYKEFVLNIETWIEGLKALSKAESFKEILYPGEPEYRTYIHRLEHGIPY